MIMNTYIKYVDCLIIQKDVKQLNITWFELVVHLHTHWCGDTYVHVHNAL
jgi:hypothetical protein